MGIISEAAKALQLALSGPLPLAERERGWTEESKRAMSVHFGRLLRDLEAGEDLSSKPEHTTVIRGLDHWGISGGEWFDRAVAISNAVRARMPKRR